MEEIAETNETRDENYLNILSRTQPDDKRIKRVSFYGNSPECGISLDLH